MADLAPLPPPHPDPHPPTRLMVPAGAIDCHCHIFGPADRFPYLPSRTYEPAETPLERYEQLAGRLGLSRAVFVQPAVYGSDPSAMLDAIARRPGRYRAVGIVGAGASDADLERWHEGGMRGARFNFVGHLGALPEPAVVRATAERVGRLGWHIVLHVDAAALERFGADFAALPGRVVIDHMARLPAADGVDQPGFRRLLDLVSRPNVHVKISAGDRMVAAADRLSDAVPFMAALAAAAPERALWGTDWPHPNIRFMPDDGDLIDLLAEAVPDEGLRNAILVDNPRLLYDFA